MSDSSPKVGTRAAHTRTGQSPQHLSSQPGSYSVVTVTGRSHLDRLKGCHNGTCVSVTKSHEHVIPIHSGLFYVWPSDDLPFCDPEGSCTRREQRQLFRILVINQHFFLLASRHMRNLVASMRLGLPRLGILVLSH